MTTHRLLLISVFALASSAAQAALPSDCKQSDYPRWVIPACTELVAKDPNDAVAYFKRGKAYLEGRTDVRDVNAAIADLTKAVELKPDYAEAYNLRGMGYWRLKDTPRALADESKAIELDPALARTHRTRGYIYLQQHEHDRALADFSNAIELAPSLPVGYFYRALAYDAKGEGGRAVVDLKQAFKLGLGDRMEYRSQDEVDRIGAILTKAIERNGADAIAWFGRGRVDAMNQEWERAVADYSDAIERDPALVAAYIYRGHAYAELRDDDPRALADFNKAIELDPKNARAYVARGLYSVGRLSATSDQPRFDAMADYTKAIELDPKFAQAYIARAMLHAIESEWAPAKADFAKALDLEWMWWGMMQMWPNLVGEIEAERQAAPR
jgi:tetratricopeptide (TPR) repeat protein